MSSSRLDNLFGDPEDDPLLQEDSLGEANDQKGKHRQNGQEDDHPAPPISRTSGEAKTEPADAPEEGAASGAEFGEWTSDVWSSVDDPGTSTAPGAKDESSSDASGSGDVSNAADASDADAEDPVDLPDLGDADPGATSDSPTASLTALLGKPRNGEETPDAQPDSRPDERIVTVDAEAAARGHLDPLRTALADGWTIRRVQIDGDRLQFILQSLEG